MQLGTKQRIFARAFGRLLIEIFTLKGHAVTVGDVLRSAEEAERQGKSNSVHTLKLAADLNLFKLEGGRWAYQRESQAHARFGVWWKGLTGYYSPQTLQRYSTHQGDPAHLVEFCWGGDWEDGNHYSIKHKGVK